MQFEVYHKVSNVSNTSNFKSKTFASFIIDVLSIDTFGVLTCVAFSSNNFSTIINVNKLKKASKLNNQSE